MEGRGVETRCGTIHNLETMKNLANTLGPVQEQMLRHWVELDAVGLHPDSKYLAARFGVSKARAIGILSRLRDTGYVSVFGSKLKGTFAKSRTLCLTRKAREYFGESDGE